MAVTIHNADTSIELFNTMNHTESEDFPSLIYPSLQMTTRLEVTFTASFVLIQDESSKSTLITGEFQ